MNFWVSIGPPDLYISAGMASAPGALPHESWLIALVTSSVVGGKSSSTLASTCESRFIAASFIEEG